MAIALLLAVLMNSLPLQAEVTEQRQAELLHMLKHDCGSCHGMTLKGGLGPALLPETLTGKPDDYLVHSIMNGRPPTPMPPWRGILTEEEVAWLVKLLRKGVD
jgi:cytochrome c55X